MEPSLARLFAVFGRIGILSFGGPAAQIALMHGELVARHKWLTEQQFLGALSFCMMLPGPEAMQLATYAGWRLRGVAGGLVAGLLFVLPGACVIFALALGYARFGEVPLVQSLFAGIKAAVVVIVLQALMRLARRALTGGLARALAGTGFVAMFFLSVPFPIILAGAALIGAVAMRPPDPGPCPAPAVLPWRRTLATVALWGGLWAAPVTLAAAIGASFLTEVALFFSKLAVVTFGGAYAVLAYMTQEVVETNGWLSTAQMIDALGLAETTPGPLILVTQFVATLAGFQQGGPVLAFSAGALALWVTFTPCFLWIFAGAPYVEALLARPRLRGALDAISAAVTGVILSLSVWFALHVLFAEIHSGRLAPVPALDSFSWQGAALILVAGVLLFGFGRGMLTTLAATAALAGMLPLVTCDHTAPAGLSFCIESPMLDRQAAGDAHVALD